MNDDILENHTVISVMQKKGGQRDTLSLLGLWFLD